MKDPIDQFSRQADLYQQYRPLYPVELYDFILSRCRSRECAWDCGTGNGQVAAVLANAFDQVLATDLSEEQLSRATEKENIIYQKTRSEKTFFPDHHFDLITVAQALHWFDIPAFFTEVRRVLKPGGLIAVWGYGLIRISPAVDVIIDDFYRNVVGSYWKPERRMVDDHYASIPFPFAELATPRDLSIRAHWKLRQVEGYFRTWSSVQHYREANQGRDPVSALIHELQPHFTTQAMKVQFPIFLRLGEG